MGKRDEANVDVVRKSIRAFLEEKELYAPAELDLGAESLSVNAAIAPPAISAPCGTCVGERTWAFKTDDDAPRFLALPTSEALFEYACTDCGKERRVYWVRFAVLETVDRRIGATLSNSGLAGTTIKEVMKLSAEKIGQWPSPLPRLSNQLDRALGAEAPLYRKALACLSHGFGIGAYAYLRRIVEARTDDLLDRIQKVLEAEGDSELLVSS
jgi:hypothetical protein